MKNYLHNSGPGIVIGVPTLGRPVPLSWAFALKSMNPPTNFNTLFHVIQGKPIDVARDEFAKLAIDKDCKYLFMLGDDVIIPNHTLRQLIFRMEQDPSIGVIGGVYCTKTNPSEPLIYKGNGKGAYWDWKVGEFFEITGLGMDCTLIRVSLLQELKSNWFKTVSDDKYLDAINAAESWTEDLYFCKRVLEETKYKIYVDTAVLCEHWDINTGIIYKLPVGSLPMRRAVVSGEIKQCLVVNENPLKVVTEGFQVTTLGSKDCDYRGTSPILPFDNLQFDWVVAYLDDPTTLAYSLGEFQRVCKVGGKITLTLHDFIDKQLIISTYNGTLRNEVVEIEVK